VHKLMKNLETSSPLPSPFYRSPREALAAEACRGTQAGPVIARADAPAAPSLRRAVQVGVGGTAVHGQLAAEPRRVVGAARRVGFLWQELWELGAGVHICSERVVVSVMGRVAAAGAHAWHGCESPEHPALPSHAWKHAVEARASGQPVLR
jgi:hypothetical protein